MIKDTKLARKKIMAEFLDSIPLDRDFTEEEVSIVNAITGWHYRRYQKRNTPPPNFSTRNIWVIDRRDFKSWNKAIDAKPEHIKRRQDVKQACRAALRPLMDELRQYAIECERCKSTKFLQVDHKSIPFNTIFEEWFEQNPNVDTGTGHNQIGHNLINLQDLNSWLDYHNQRADYQILCRSCNASKG
jgi:hypothetical protein